MTHLTDKGVTGVCCRWDLARFSSHDGALQAKEIHISIQQCCSVAVAASQVEGYDRSLLWVQITVTTTVNRLCIISVSASSKAREKWTEAGRVAGCEAGICLQRSWTPDLILIYYQKTKESYFVMKVWRSQTSTQPQVWPPRCQTVSGKWIFFLFSEQNVTCAIQGIKKSTSAGDKRTPLTDFGSGRVKVTWIQKWTESWDCSKCASLMKRFSTYCSSNQLSFHSVL